MTLSDFIAVVRSATLRGNALDAQIGPAIRRAVLFIESNYNMPYMRRKIDVAVAVDDTAVVLNDTTHQAGRLKSIERVRFNDGGDWYYLKQVDSWQLVSNEAEAPVAFELTSTLSAAGATEVTLTFDSAWAEAQTLEIWGFWRTEIDLTNPSSAGIWLINNAEDVLLARTMMNMAPVMRDPQVLGMYQQLWMEGQQTLIAAVDAMEQGAR